MTGTIAVLWDEEIDTNGPEPFKWGHLSRSYETFSKMAAEHDGTVYIARYDWYDDGMLEKAFVFDGDEWAIVHEVAVDVVFDKYKYDERTIPLKQEIEGRHPVLSPLKLEDICKDKLLTYETFRDHVPKTVAANKDDADAFLKQDGRAVLKPAFDHGGHGVAVIDSMDEYEAYEKNEHTLLQRFVDSSKGYPGLVDGVHDLRIIAVNGEPIVAFVRTPASGFISNVSQGGTLHHVPLDDVPEAAWPVYEAVADRFEAYTPNMFAVDLIFDADGDAHILELNSKPGMSFYDDDEIESWKRPLMRRVVETLCGMLER